MLRSLDGDKPGRRIPKRLWIGLAVVLVIVGAALGGTFVRWIAGGLILAALPYVWEPLARLPVLAQQRDRIAKFLPLAVLLGLAAVLFDDLLLGRPPVSRDHGIHYFQTQILIDELVPRGQLSGWSERLNSGYAFGDSYPVLGYLFTGAAELLSFRMVPGRVSYAWGLLAIWSIAVWGVYRLGRLLGEELSGAAPADADAPVEPDGADPASDQPSLRERLLDPRWAGALAAIAWLLDPGGSREGGWNYLMFHGVWPQLLSTALWVASLSVTWEALRRPSVRRLAFAGLLIGGSVLAHPFGMLTGAFSAVAWPIVLWASGASRRLPSGMIRFWLVIHLAGGLICASTVFTLLASAGEMARSPVPWHPLGTLIGQFVSGELFRDYRSWIGVLTVVGGAIALRRGRGLTWMVVILVAGIFVLASEQAITVLHLDLFVSAFKNIQFPRYSIALKPLMYALAGVGGAVLMRTLIRVPKHDAEEGSARPLVARVLACVALAPLVVSLFDSPGELAPDPVGAVQVLEGSAHEQDEAALRVALEQEIHELGDQPLKVAFLRQAMGGGTYPMFTLTDLGAQVVLDGHMPAVNYKYQVGRRKPAVLRALGVTHVLHDRPLATGDLALSDELEEVGRYGPWILQRLKGATREQVYQVKPDGEGIEVLIERDGPEKHRVTVTGIDETTGPRVIEMPMGPYRRWKAHDELGDPIDLQVNAFASGAPGIRFILDRSAIVTFEYVTPPVERWIEWISLLATLLTALALVWNREIVLAERLHAPLAIRISWMIGLISLLIAGGIGLNKRQRQLSATWEEITKVHMSNSQLAGGQKLGFSRDLIIEGAWSVTLSNPDGCDGMLGKDAKSGCTQDRSRPRTGMNFRKPYIYRCARFVVPPRGTAELKLEGIEASEDVYGFFTHDSRSVFGLSIQFPGQDELRDLPQQRRHHFHIAAGVIEGRGTFLLQNSAEYPQTLCIAMAAAVEK